MEKESENKKILKQGQKTHPRPPWVPKTIMGEEELCPDCFKVVGERSRYNLVSLDSFLFLVYSFAHVARSFDQTSFGRG